MRKSEVREMPSLPRGGGEDLVRDEQVSSRRVCRICFFDWLGNSLLSNLNLMAGSSPGIRLLPWHLSCCQFKYPMNPCVFVYVCMLVFICMGFDIKILTVATI